MQRAVSFRVDETDNPPPVVGEPLSSSSGSRSRPTLLRRTTMMDSIAVEADSLAGSSTGSRRRPPPLVRRNTLMESLRALVAGEPDLQAAPITKEAEHNFWTGLGAFF